MAHSEICPVCKGKGKVPLTEDSWDDKTCNGCSGKGWVVVPDDKVLPIPYPYPIYPEPYYPPYKPYIWYLGYKIETTDHTEVK